MRGGPARWKLAIMERKGARPGEGHDVERLLDELYATPPSDFVSRREQLAVAAKADGTKADGTKNGTGAAAAKPDAEPEEAPVAEPEPSRKPATKKRR
mgnify:CR=1 FL=1